MTHRLDSDAPLPYAQIIDSQDEVVAPSRKVFWRKFEEKFYNKNLLDFAKKKTKNLIGIISHCNANSNRDLLVEKLKKFIDSDVYGVCGTHL